jgi:hypothetical protein
MDSTVTRLCSKRSDCASRCRAVVLIDSFEFSIGAVRVRGDCWSVTHPFSHCCCYCSRGCARRRRRSCGSARRDTARCHAAKSRPIGFLRKDPDAASAGHARANRCLVRPICLISDSGSAAAPSRCPTASKQWALGDVGPSNHSRSASSPRCRGAQQRRRCLRHALLVQGPFPSTCSTKPTQSHSIRRKQLGFLERLRPG